MWHLSTNDTPLCGSRQNRLLCKQWNSHAGKVKEEFCYKVKILASVKNITVKYGNNKYKNLFVEKIPRVFYEKSDIIIPSYIMIRSLYNQ